MNNVLSGTSLKQSSGDLTTVRSTIHLRTLGAVNIWTGKSRQMKREQIMSFTSPNRITSTMHFV